MNNQRQRRQLTTRKPQGQKNTRTAKPLEKTMTAATHTQAVEQKDTQDAQVTEITTETQETAAPESPSASSQANTLANQPENPAQSQGLMRATQAHYQQQLQSLGQPLEPQRRLTLPIPHTLHRDIKVYCAQNDLQVGTFMGALLITGFNSYRQPQG